MLLFKECELAAAKNAHSLIHIPVDWIDFQGENGMVDKGMMGKSYWMKWNAEKPVPDNQEEAKYD